MLSVGQRNKSCKLSQLIFLDVGGGALSGQSEQSDEEQQ